MSNTDWDTSVKIGSRTRGPGASTRETVVKGKSALNAAQRSGAILSTEKKYGGANSARGGDGQRQAKLDREDGIIKPLGGLSKESQALMQSTRTTFTPVMSRVDLGKKVSETPATIEKFETGKLMPNQQQLHRLEVALGVILTGTNMGQPKPAKVFKRNQAAKK